MHKLGRLKWVVDDVKRVNLVIDTLKPLATTHIRPQDPEFEVWTLSGAYNDFPYYHFRG